MSERPAAGQAPPPGAACANHRERAAVSICERCGNYVCAECAPPGGACTECRQRDPAVGFPMSRVSWSLESVFGHAWHVMKADAFSILATTWLLIVPYCVIVMAPTLFMLDDLTGAGSEFITWQTRLKMSVMYLPGLVISAPFLLGILAHAVARVQGRTVGVAIVGEMLGRSRSFIVLLLVTWPALLLLGLLQQTPSPGDNPLAAFSPAIMGTNIMLSAFSAPVLLWQYVGAVELILSPDLGGLDALKVAGRNLLRRPVMPLVTAFVAWLVVLASVSCCILPSLYFGPYVVLVFATMCIAMRTHPTD